MRGRVTISVPSPVLDRFWARVEDRDDDSCWEWTGAKLTTGYGTLKIDGQRRMAHRFAYELLIGPIPPGLVIDHLCCNPSCVNPSHMEPVTIGENVRRGTAGDYLKARTHCPEGHPYSGDNLILERNGTARRCRACKNRANRELRARKKAAA